jgi:hypothetical protein
MQLVIHSHLTDTTEHFEVDTKEQAEFVLRSKYPDVLEPVEVGDFKSVLNKLNKITYLEVNLT